MCQEIWGFNVEIKMLVESVLVGLFKGNKPCNTGIIDQHINTSQNIEGVFGGAVYLRNIR